MKIYEIFLLLIPVYTAFHFDIECKKSTKHIQVGNAIDVLNHDIPRCFTNKPDMSIFTENIEFRDPYKARLKGKNKYTQIFKLFRMINQIFLKNRYFVNSQLNYDQLNNLLKVRIQTKMYPLGKIIFLDFISYYYFDRNGKIYLHVVDQFNLITTSPVYIPQIKTFQNTPIVGFQYRGKNKPWPETSTDIYGNIVPSNSPFAQPKKRKPNKCEEVIQSLFDVLDDITQTCHNDYDCPRTMICCDWVVTKTCCSGIKNRPIPLFIPFQQKTWNAQ